MADGTKAGWTAGPWRVAGKKSGYIVYAGNDPEIGSVQIANVGNYRDTELLPFTKERWDADCALIAAAPDLYEALEALLDAYMENAPSNPGPGFWDLDRDPAVIAARAALARARGDAQ